MPTIIELTRPDDTQTAQIRALEAACKEADGLHGSFFLDASLNFDKNMKSVLLLYEGDVLAAVMTIFAPGRKEAELCALTLPACRRRGYFRALYDRAVAEVQKFGVPSVLLTCERDSDAGFETVSAFGARLDHTEYSLWFDGGAAGYRPEEPFDLELCEVGADLTPEGMDKLVVLAVSAFGGSEQEEREFLQNGLSAPERTQYVAKLQGEPVGMAAANEENGDVTIYGVGVAPEFRGRGFGRQMMTLVIRRLLERGVKNLLIEVDDTNDRARHLYESLGFAPETIVDYYRAAL